MEGRQLDVHRDTLRGTLGLSLRLQLDAPEGIPQCQLFMEGVSRQLECLEAEIGQHVDMSTSLRKLSRLRGSTLRQGDDSWPATGLICR